jgi:hypothetical protein
MCFYLGGAGGVGLVRSNYTNMRKVGRGNIMWSLFVTEHLLVWILEQISVAHPIHR